MSAGTPELEASSMNLKQIVLGIELAGFSALTAYAIWQHGYFGVFEVALSSWATSLLLVDLVIALGLALVWMMSDSRERGLAFLPYALLTLLFGSVGPLLYLIRREGHATARTRLARVAQAA
jgi:hypothetical protein